jgi:hypothetical protein
MLALVVGGSLFCGTLYGAILAGGSASANSTARLVKFNGTSFTSVYTFGSLPFAGLAGMLATDSKGKWWLAAGESGRAGDNTLFYAEDISTPAVATRTKTSITTLEYVEPADEFLGTWQKAGTNEHLYFGAIDPYVGRENTMVDLTANASIPWSTFGASCLDPSTLAFTFVVGIESPAGGKFSLARVAPTGSGVSVEFGAPCVDCTIQSVLQGKEGPLALTMSPMAYTKTMAYTYTLVPWDLNKGTPSGAPLGKWTTKPGEQYNTYVTTASSGGAVFAADAFGRSLKRLDLASGEVSELGQQGIDGALIDLVWVDEEHGGGSGGDREGPGGRSASR